MNKNVYDRANETFRVSEIIFRYILGELTDEEKEQLERWLDEKPDHKYLFEDLVKEAKKSEKIKAYGRIDLYEALEDLLRKKRKMEQMRKKRRFITWATGVAAVIYLWLLLSCYIFIGEIPVKEWKT